jgi:pimeloyl-ACP methyl ester carboxylesterase
MKVGTRSVTKTYDDGEPTVVLLHGILGNGDYWSEVAAQLPGQRGIALDLLGFGTAPKPARVAYDYADHVDAVVATLDALGLSEPVVLVGHSMGALIALRLAAEHPELVSRLILVGMPVFESAAAARKAIGSTRLRRTLLYGPISWSFCQVWCRALGPISRRIAPLYLRRLPPAVARGTVEHSWASYSRSLSNIVERQDVATDLQRVDCPTIIAYGDLDDDASLPRQLELPGSVEVRVMPGNHHLPLERPSDVADLIRGSYLGRTWTTSPAPTATSPSGPATTNRPLGSTPVAEPVSAPDGSSTRTSRPMVTHAVVYDERKRAIAPTPPARHTS